MKKIYLFDIDENEGKGIFRISHVEEPAIEVNFVAFSNEAPIKFSVDEEKMRVTGPILIPDIEIYRKDLDGYVVFTKETIEKGIMTFKRGNDVFSINVEHSDTKAPAFLMEDWIIKDPKNDKSNLYGFNLAEGTWMGTMQITDKDYWEKFIKSGVVNGFSVEIDKSSVKIKDKFNMEKPNENLETENLGAADTDKAQIYWEGDTVDVGVKIFVDEAMTEIAPDGEYTDAQGNAVVVKEGVVIEIKKAEVVEDVQAEAETPTDEVKTEFLSKEEFTQIISQLSSRVDALELKLNEKSEENEKLSKELEEVKMKAPGAPSFLFKKSEVKKIVSEVKKSSFSEMLKQSYKEQGKL